MNKEFISLVTLNYNGREFLRDFFESALSIDYPQDKYEIIMVDNNSTDGSVEFVKKYFPKVKIIEAGANLGFGRGNNLGIKAAKEDLVFVLNNDTVLNKDSVKEIVKCFVSLEKKEKVGAVNSKLVFIDSYLPLRVESAHFSDYILPKKLKPVNNHPLVFSKDKKEEFFEKVLLPIRHNYVGGFSFKLSLKPYKKREFTVYLGDTMISEGSFEKVGEESVIKLDLNKAQVLANKRDLIQNAGNIYFRDGSGRDRGTIIYQHRQFFEEDEGQYDEREPIQGFCGAGVLLNKKALEEVGYFDSDFFLYYEDSELSFRLRESGWKIFYCPDSVIRHIHSATNKEWSNLFIYNAERGRLLFLSKHWPRSLALIEWLKYILKDTFGAFAYHLYKGDLRDAFGKVRIRLKVNLSLLFPFLKSLMRSKRMSHEDVKELI